MQALEIINQAAILLLDPTNVRWPHSQLLDYLNDGQKEIVIHRPDASIADDIIILDDGNTRQMIPADSIRLLTVVRNMGQDGTTPGLPIMVVSRDILDTQIPDWHLSEPSTQIKHFIYDPKAPKIFYVFPRPAAGVHIEIITSVPPKKILATGEHISISEIYSNALMDYIIYRALSKDAEYADPNKSAGYYNMFLQTLGVKTQVDMAVTPKGK